MSVEIIKTKVGKWEGREVFLRTKKDADAIEIIRYLVSMNQHLEKELAIATAQLEEQQATEEQEPQIIVPH